MLNKMKKKTYRNFLIVRNLLMKEKGYGTQEASDIAHLIFGNYELDNNLTIADYYNRILTKDEFEHQCAELKGALI